ncbi:DNA repair exonuclease SbcCD nuclease subunit [Cohnella sp. OV330]|uniref:metallophosphoesterase family protein n=1 Tax=Cohnella sp. OV330 TaxID=1855288 RepID=UPI0008EFCF99|nr:DNA repair exonuclease [Cohnella sp. OV330]SFB41292.1 DNA repair exonuclease SbcCD nuclease subunit [Cohnella sp. OV330]
MQTPFRFMHAADLHLDSPFRGLSKVPSAVRERLRNSTLNALDKLVETVLTEELDFLVLSGDLYDAADRSLRAQLRMQKAMGRLAEAGAQAFVVHGNHDPSGGRSARLDWPASVHVFGAEEVGCRPAYTREGKLAAHVYGISYRESAVKDNLATRYRVQEGAPFHLAVLHGNIDGLEGHDNYAPCRLAELTASGFDYWAFGHIHDRRVLHEYPHVVYPGNIQGRSIRETGPKGAYRVDVSEQGRVRLSFRELSEVRWLVREVRIGEEDGEQALQDKLLEAAEDGRREAEGRPLVLRLRLTGSGALLERLLRDGEAEEWAGELRSWLGSPDERDDWVWIERIAVEAGGGSRAEAGSSEDGFLGELLRLTAESASDPAASRALLREAAEPLRHHPKLRQWLDGRDDAQRAELIARAGELAAALLREGGE